MKNTTSDLIKMKKVSILIPQTAIIEAVADPHYMFNAVNQFLIASGKVAIFDVKLTGLSSQTHLNGNAFTVHADQLLDEVEQTDLIIIPAISGDIEEAIQLNQEIIPWVIKHRNQGAEVASLCYGAFILAATGLLDGRKASTHWNAANEFREMFPNVELVDGSIVTEENGIYSSGGANSYWTLLLHLVEKYTDRATAILAAKFFAVDIDRNSQAAFAIFQGQKAHNDEDIKRTQNYIEENIEERISVDELAEIVAVGRRTFERRFKQATNNSVLEYIQRVKIEAAKRSFESSRKNINEVMYDVGYSDSKAFRTVFKKITGLTPAEYRSKYNKLAVV